MKRRAATVLVALLAFASCRRREAAAAAPENPYARTLQPLIEDFLRKQEIPGFAIAIVEDGRVAWEHGFGVFSLKGDDAVTPRSLFHMASITKPFVATAVMQLVEKGRPGATGPWA